MKSGWELVNLLFGQQWFWWTAVKSSLCESKKSTAVINEVSICQNYSLLLYCSIMFVIQINYYWGGFVLRWTIFSCCVFRWRVLSVIVLPRMKLNLINDERDCDSVWIAWGESRLHSQWALRLWAVLEMVQMEMSHNCAELFSSHF